MIKHQVLARTETARTVGHTGHNCSILVVDISLVPTIGPFSGLWFTSRAGSDVAQSVERATPGEKILGSIPAV